MGIDEIFCSNKDSDNFSSMSGVTDGALVGSYKQVTPKLLKQQSNDTPSTYQLQYQVQQIDFTPPQQNDVLLIESFGDMSHVQNPSSKELSFGKKTQDMKSSSHNASALLKHSKQSEGSLAQSFVVLSDALGSSGTQVSSKSH